MSLICLDVDGTLIESYFRKGVEKTVANYALVTVLEGRLERITQLVQQGHSFALVTNQAGVALGYQSPQDVYDKMGRVIGALECFRGAPVSVHVCMHHPEARLPEWRENPCRRRKPEPGLLFEACDEHGVASPGLALFVGDMETDARAAAAAGMPYADAAEFFRPRPF